MHGWCGLPDSNNERLRNTDLHTHVRGQYLPSVLGTCQVDSVSALTL